MEITFRYAESKDIPLILQFINKLAEYEKIAQDVHATEALLYEWMFEKQRAEAIIAAADGKDIGFALFYQTFPAYLGKGGIYIDDLYIDSEYRGKGIGRKLFGHVAEIALERGCGRLEWCCLNWNNSSMEFYRSLGALPLDECTVFRMSEETIGQLLAL